MASATQPAWPIQRRCREAVDQRCRPGAPAVRYLDHRLWGWRLEVRRVFVRSPFRAHHCRRVAREADGEKRRGTCQVVAARKDCTRYAACTPIAGAIRRDIDRCQTSALGLASGSRVAKSCDGGRRPRRRHHLRHPPQPPARTLVAADVHLDGQGQRPPLHPHHLLRDLPLPRQPHPRTHRPPAHRAAARRRLHPRRPAARGEGPRRAHRPSRAPPGGPARRLAQPARVDRARARGRAAGPEHEPLPRPHRRPPGLRGRARPAHAHQPVQPAPHLAGPGPRGAGRRGRRRLRLGRLDRRDARRRDPAPAAGAQPRAGRGAQRPGRAAYTGGPSPDRSPPWDKPP
jgi:hypothetical protein